MCRLLLQRDAIGYPSTVPRLQMQRYLQQALHILPYPNPGEVRKLFQAGRLLAYLLL